MASNSVAARYFRIRKTVYKMLENRNYIVSVGDRNKSLEDFAAMMENGDRSSLTVMGFKGIEADGEPTEKIGVFFPAGDLSMKEIKGYGLFPHSSSESCATNSTSYRG